MEVLVTTTSVTHEEIFRKLTFETVWRALGGPALAGRGDERRARAFWRDGDGLSVSVHLGKKVWTDHAAGNGGGVVDLVTTVLGIDKPTAWRWLYDLAGVELERRTTAQIARRRDAVQAAVPEAAELWVAFKDVYDTLRQYAGVVFDLYHVLRDRYWNDGTLTAAERVELEREIADTWSWYQMLRRAEERMSAGDPRVLVPILRRAVHGRAA